MTPPALDEQVALLMQGTDYGDATLQRNMASELRLRLVASKDEGRPLRVYCGYDPTKPDLHLGHTITMRKLRQFQELGHEVTFLIGDYTARVGDPSDKDKLRPRLSPAEIEANAATYAAQAFRILDRGQTRIRYNSEWLSDLRLADLIPMAANFTIQQFMARERFALRIEQGEPVYLHETLYGLMQGYDAVAQEADVQVGGSEQLFNIVVAGRKLQEAMGQRPQVGILMGILPGTDGVLRMSKSTGNTIDLTATAEDMYGKVMSLPDAAMPIYYRLMTTLTPARIEAAEAQLARGDLHPRDAKMALAREIVEVFHGRDSVVKAEEHFRRVFQERGAPDELRPLPWRTGMTLLDLVASSESALSRSEARRLIEQRGVKVDGTTWDDPRASADGTAGKMLQIGKGRFYRVASSDG